MSGKRLPGGKTVEVDDIRENESYFNKTVKQNANKMTDGRRQSGQRQNGKPVTRQERCFEDVVEGGTMEDGECPGIHRGFNH